MPGDRTYAAFISYSHATDHALGPLLQEGVEKFAKPWYRPRQRRVFLDNSVLAAESDLTQAILDGLANAENFLLLASPASAASRWVGKEVAWWLENRDRRTLFVLLTDGEVVWDNGVLDRERTTALPEALHDISEPRCVDLRAVRDVELDPRNPQWEAVLADVVAPLDGIEKSDLIGHHISERRRTKRTVTAAISVLVVLLVAAVIFAVRSEQQSDRAQQQTLVATSRQLVAQAAAIRDSRPDIARQLLVQAYRMSPTAEVLGALMESPSIPRVLRQPTMVRDVVFSPRGELLAVARDHDVVLYEGTSERAVIPLRERYGAAVAFSPDGKYLAIGTAHAFGVLVETAAPERRAEWAATAGSMVRVVSFVPGRPLLVAVESAGHARFVDFSDPARPTPGPVFAAGDALMNYDAGAVSPDGRTWARGTTDGTIELWDITSAPVLRATLRGHTGQLTSLRFAPKGAVLASGSADHTVRLWNLAQNTQYAVLSGSSLVRSTAYSPDATTLAVGDAEGTIGLWDVTDPTRPRTTPSLRGHTGSVEGLAFSADSRVLASAGKDGPGEQDTVRLWNVLDGVRSAAVAVLPGTLGGLAFAPGPVLAAGSPWKLYDLTDPARPRQTRDLGRGGPLAFSPDGTKIATGPPVVEHDIAADLPVVNRDGQAGGLVYSGDGKLIAAPGNDLEYQLWKPEGDRAVPAGVLKGSTVTAGWFAFRADGEMAVTIGHEGKSFQLWDITDPFAPVLRHTENTEADPVESVAFRSSGATFVTGSKGGVVALWDSDGQRRITAVTRHVGAVGDLAAQPGGSLLASAGAAGEVVLWDLGDETRPVEVSALRAGGRFVGATIEFSPDGRLLAGAYERTTIWSVDAARAVAQLCADSRPITENEWQQYLPDDTYDPPCA